jgi:galactose-1-phosphate uridylyltransferase
MLSLSDQEWMELADGIIRVHKFYRSLGHNDYNFGLLTIERPESRLELRFRMVVRSDYREWSRNDYTGFEIMLGEMATFRSPEEIAVQARNFWLAEIPNSS